LDKLEHSTVLIQCPSCSSSKIWKDGKRKLNYGFVQRYTCKDCETRFSGEKNISEDEIDIPRRVCDIISESKNLIVVSHGWTTGDNEKHRELIGEYQRYLAKQGLKESTIKGYVNCISSLLNNGVDLSDPESLKSYLVDLHASAGRKRNIVHAYKQLYRFFFGDSWRDAPRYERIKKPQYLPTENNLIQIISGVPNKYKPFCQFLIETGARSVEAWKIKWSDVDFKIGNVDITPVKNGEFRTLPISDKLKQMLNMLPHNTEYIFKKGLLDHFREGFRRHRVKLAEELGEPEITKCSFKTFRTFYATKISYMLDMNEVQYRLGHSNILTTQKYVQRSHSMKRDYTSRTTRTDEEDEQAIQDGFEFVKDRKGVSFWRKPK